MFCTPKNVAAAVHQKSAAKVRAQPSTNSEYAPGPLSCLPWLLVGKVGEQYPVPNGRLAQDPDEGFIVEAELDQLTPVGVADPLL